jgi:aldehyde dehydrogenase (NAD+)
MSVADYFSSMDYGPATESDAPARAWLAAHAARLGHFIDGRHAAPVQGQWFETREPASGALLASVAQGSAADVDAAVQAARRAQPHWLALGGHGRARHLYALARMLQKHSRLYAVLEALDNGKPLRETRDLDIPLAARHFLYHAGWAQLQDSEFRDYEPQGVVGQIIPWNFPLLMLAWKIAPALAMGNCVVLKPAEFTPLTALLFAELAARAGLPPGVLNVVAGDGATGAALVEHAGVDKIAFTGSTEVGRAIRSRTAGSGKALTLELGGKSPFIVFENADLDAAVEGVVDAIWFNQGEVCCAGSRLLVQEGVADDFIRRLKRRMESLRLGDPLDKTIDMGAIVDPSQLARIAGLVEAGRAEGAQIWQAPGVPAGGCFYPPTLVTGVSTASVLMREEIFGPVLAAMSFRNKDEAVELANNTRYGLAASVWTENISLALEVAPALAAGVVWINATNLFDAAAGFGGYRESGYGREGGREGLYEYLKLRAWSRLRVRAPQDGPSAAGAPAVAPLPGAGGTPGADRADSDAADTGPGHAWAVPPIDRTPKLYIGGKQVRPDAGGTLSVPDARGGLAGEVAAGNRKDIRNAVAAARRAAAWSRATGHARSQVLYFVAENLAQRRDEFADRLAAVAGTPLAAALDEVERSLARLFFHAAWADKFDGAVHAPPMRAAVLAMHEPLGVVGIVCPDEQPLLSMVSLLAPVMAMGNRAVVVPGRVNPLAATDLYQVFETSDVPGGVVNIVTGESAGLAACLAAHDDVDAVWSFGCAATAREVEALSVGNLKRTFVDHGRCVDWSDDAVVQDPLFLRQAVQVKNVWIPYGD